MMLPSNTVRLVMGPTGTVLKFSEDMGLPIIFDSKPHRYNLLRCALKVTHDNSYQRA